MHEKIWAFRGRLALTCMCNFDTLLITCTTKGTICHDRYLKRLDNRIYVLDVFFGSMYLIHVL